MSTLDIGFPSQDTKQSDDPLHGDSGDAQYFIFVNAVIYSCKWERVVGNANCWHKCNKTWNVISDYMIVFTSYDYFLPSLVACTLWHITSYFDNSNGHWPRHDTVWRWFYLSDIVGIPGGVTNHQDVANENRCCYHHLRKGQVISFTLFTIIGWLRLWEECRLICAMTTLMSISTRSSALHIWDLPNKETYQQQPNKGKSYQEDTNKQQNKGKTYHPERESKRCHSFTRPVAFRSETCENKLRTTWLWLWWAQGKLQTGQMRALIEDLGWMVDIM